MAVIGINTPGLSLGSLFAIASLSVSENPHAMAGKTPGRHHGVPGMESRS